VETPRADRRTSRTRPGHPRLGRVIPDEVGWHGNLGRPSSPTCVRKSLITRNPNYLDVDKLILFFKELEKDQMAYLNKMLDRGKRRKQFESFVLNADLNSGVDKTKTSENQRLITPPVIQSNSNGCISQFSTRSITRRLTSLIKGTVPRKTAPFFARAQQCTGQGRSTLATLSTFKLIFWPVTYSK